MHDYDAHESLHQTVKFMALWPWVQTLWRDLYGFIVKFENVSFTAGGDKMNCYDIYKRISLNCEMHNPNVEGSGRIWL